MSDLIKIEFPKARKTYTCDLCDGEITPGTRYMSQSGKIEGKFVKLHYHLTCWNILKAFFAQNQEEDWDEDTILQFVKETVCSGCDEQKSCTYPPFDCDRAKDHFEEGI